MIRYFFQYICYSMFLMLSLFTTSGFGQTAMAELLKAFRKLDYAVAEKQAEAILADWQSHNPITLETAHKVLGVIQYTKNDLTAARNHFQQAIQINPQTVLDSVYVSPKIIEWFRQIKTSYRPENVPAAHIRYIVVPDRRPGAAVRSVLLPGWGQLYKDQPVRGWTLMAVTGISLATWGVSTWQTQTSRRDYLKAELPETIRQRYDDYNTWYKRQQMCRYVTAALWATAVVDALLTSSSQKEVKATFRPVFGKQLCMVHCSVVF